MGHISRKFVKTTRNERQQLEIYKFNEQVELMKKFQVSLLKVISHYADSDSWIKTSMGTVMWTGAGDGPSAAQDIINLIERKKEV